MADSWQHRSMRDILRVVFSRWLTAIIIVALVIGAAAAATWKLPKVYESEARLTSPLSEGEQTLSGDIRNDSALEVRLKMQFDVLTGDTVLSRALARADDHKLARQQRIEDVKINAAGKAIASGGQERIKELRKNVRMETTGGQSAGKSLSFTLYVRADSAPRAKLLADLLTEEFIARYNELLLGQLKGLHEAAVQDVESLTAKGSDYAKARSEFQALLADKSEAESATLLSLLGEGPPADVGTARGQAEAILEYVRIRSEFNGVSTLRDEVSKAVKTFEAAIQNKDVEVEKLPFIPAEFATRPAIARISEKLADRYSMRAELRSRYDETNYQPLVQIKAEIRELERELHRLFNSELQGLDATVAMLKSKLDPLEQYGRQFQDGQGKAGMVDLVAAQEAYARWKHQRKLYDDLQERKIAADTRYKQVSATPQIVTMDSAIEPDQPIRPIVWLNLVIGGIIGVLLALTYLFLADFYDHSVRSTDDIERYLGVPVLASVSRMIRRPVQT